MSPDDQLLSQRSPGGPPPGEFTVETSVDDDNIQNRTPVVHEWTDSGDRVFVIDTEAETSDIPKTAEATHTGETAVVLPNAKRPGIIWRCFAAIYWLLRNLFGIAVLLAVGSLLAALPLLNFIVLGYLLDVEGRVARSGRIRDAFPLLNIAPQLGSILIGVGLFLIPIRLLADAAADARLISPGGTSDVVMHRILSIVSVITVIHLVLAIARGGYPGCFVRPIKNVRWIIKQFRTENYWAKSSDQIVAFFAQLQLRRYFWLGLRGFIGAFAWLVVPTALFAAANRTEGGPLLVTLLGGVLLMLVLSWVPFLQAHFAAEGRFRAMFELKTVRQLYLNAPFSWLITLLITLLLALPLYLFKIVLVPRDALWLITPVFLVSIYPAKVITGWAYHRAKTRERRTHFLLRWAVWLVMLPLLTTFVFLLFFTQFIGEHGKGVLFEHHAFLLPVPF